MARTSGPYVAGIVACKRIERDQFDNFTAVGILSELVIEATDDGLLAGFHTDFPIAVLFGIAPGSAQGTRRVELVYFSPGGRGTVVYQRTWPLIPDEVTWQPCEFSVVIRALGLHRCRLQIDDEPSGEFSFLVKQLVDRPVPLHA